MNHHQQFAGDFQHEWKAHELIQAFPALAWLMPLIPEILHFNRDCAVLVLRYLDEYTDLEEFYTQSRCLEPAIATALGQVLGRIHDATLDQQDYRAFLQEDASDPDDEDIPDFGHDLQTLTPDVFERVSREGLAFYPLYQRDRTLHRAIAQLSELYEPCCLIHNDLKFDNILLHQDWQTRLAFHHPEHGQMLAPSPLRIIDWEQWSWGDPTHDVGIVIAQFLKLWLKSLSISRDIDIQLALRLASTPLEQVQPSLVAFMRSYIAHAPGILEQFPDFFTRVMQFAGLALLESITTRLHYYEPFGNAGICMFQVAGRLLCYPDAAIHTAFGLTAPQILNDTLPISYSYQQAEDGRQKAEGRRQKAEGRRQKAEGGRQKTGLNAQDSNAQDSTVNTVAFPSLRDQNILAPSLSSSLPAHLLTLSNLLQTLQIHPDFTLVHPPYPPAEWPDVLSNQASSLSVDVRRTLWLRSLRDYIYDIYFSGELNCELGEQCAEFRPGSSNIETLKNNSRRGLDADIYDVLQAHNHGTGYFEADWCVERVLQTGVVRVEKDGLTLHINPAHHLQEGDRPKVGHSVAIRLPNHHIEAGFYVAVGNAGEVADEAPAIDICLNMTPEGAIQCMDTLTQQLNAIPIPFSLKVLIDADSYPRRDRVIIQIERRHYAVLHPILQRLYRDGRSHLRPEIPLWMKAIAPGIGLAELPDTEPYEFGLHRAQRLAEAIITAWETGHDSPDERMRQIDLALSQHGLSLNHPYLNPGSDDIYMPLVSLQNDLRNLHDSKIPKS
ncbi:MAG: T3SS effector HopA1 family protein [Leptolyngbyaceae bacterium]|nr:T3SS effector HopA1 family protein [Leptolyngbyaceae bacterium]